MFTKTSWKIESSAGQGLSVSVGIGLGVEAGTVTIRDTRKKDTVVLHLKGAGGMVGVGGGGKSRVVAPAHGPDVGIAHDRLPSRNSYIFACGSQSTRMWAEDFEGYALVGKVAGGLYGNVEGAAILFTDRSVNRFQWSDVKAFGFLSGVTLSMGGGITGSVFQFSVTASGIDVFRTDPRALERCRSLQRTNPDDFLGQPNACTFGAQIKSPGSKKIRVLKAMPRSR